VLEIPTDGEGLDVAALHDLGAAQPPKVIYTIPNFQNPSGATMSLSRRLELVELAERWGALILEDDPYRQLRFSGEDLPSLQHLAAGNVRVVGVHTFSKILAPGLRVGWVTADPETIGRMIDAKQGLDTCTNVPMQRLVARFMSRGLLDAHILRLRPEYRERRDRMQQRLQEHFSDLGASWTHPEGGFFLWLTLPEEVDTEALFAVALAEGVSFIPGPAFSVGRRFANALRLAFSVCSGERTDLGIRRLRTAVDRHLAGA
jgi:2-aminoadipate transaminase